MNRLSAAIAALLFLAFSNCASAETDPGLQVLKDIDSPALQEGARDIEKHDYAAAIATLRPLAEQGNQEAQYRLALLYRDGLGLGQDYAQAASWFRKAADQGHTKAQANLAELYEWGQGVPKDLAQALALFQKAAARNDAFAQATLGEMYFDGSDVARDDAQALLWFRKSADQGNADGQNGVGLMYERGRGIPQDDAQAVGWYQKAANQGNSSGEDSLGWMYHLGHGVPKDDGKALEWIRKSAAQGDMYAENNLGVMYRDGDGVPKDDAIAVDWFRKAAEQGESAAEGSLGWMYQKGRGVPQDDALALEWYRKSAAQGQVRAENNLGVMYRDGLGVAKDDAESVSWFRMGAEKDDAKAQNNLGWMYHEGRGVPQDPAQALEWYRKSAAQGDADAENNLGWSYEKGEGVAQDQALARQWFEKAVADGSSRARANLDAMNPFNGSVAQQLANSALPRGLVQHATSTSGATILKDDIVYTVAADGTYTMDENSVIRVNLAQSVEKWAQAYLSYSSSLEDLKVIEAYTIDKDGKRIEVTPDKIITQQSPISTSAPSFSDVQVKAVVFPDVEAGATVAMHIIRTVKHPLFAGQFSMAEYFPATWEIKDTRVTLIAPVSLHLQVEAIGMQGGAVKSDKDGSNTWIWTLHDASQVVTEVGSIDPTDYGPRVAATSFPDYPAAARAYLDGAEPKAKVTPNVRKLAGQITQGITDPRARAVAIYNWVSHNIRYVSLTFGLGGVVPHDADAILAAHYGDCKDHVVLLQALLAAAGIPSSPVLVNAVSVYWQPDIAMAPGVFDHAITYIPQFDVFVDSTAEVAPFGVLPPTEAGKPALVTRGRDGKPVLVHLPFGDATRNTTRTTLIATMSADGSVTGQTTNADTGVFEFVDRLVAWHIPAGQESQIAGTLLAQFGAPGSGTLVLGDARDLARPYIYTSTFSISGYANVPGPGSFTMPVGVPGLGGIIGLSHDTATAARTHPIACLASHKVEDSMLTLPTSIQVRQLPVAVHLANDIGHYDATYSQTGQSIRIHRELVLAPRNALCGPDDYQQMRALGAVIARDFRAQVVY